MRDVLTPAILVAACASAFGPATTVAQQVSVASEVAVGGTVVHAQGATPVAGAYVSLIDRMGEGVAAVVSDEDGRFRLILASPSASPYRLRVARTGSATWTSEPLALWGAEELDIRVGLEVSELGLAALRADAEARCAEAGRGQEDEGGSIVIGQVRDGRTGQPVREAQVWLRRGTANALPLRSGPSGIFLLCDIEGGPFELQASAPGRLGPGLRISPEEEPFVVRDLVISRDMLAEALGMPSEAPEGETAALRGHVRAAETGEPVAGAHVRIPEIDASRVTDAAGGFFITGLSRRPYYVVTEYLGAASDTVPVDLTWGSVTVALLTLQTEPVELPELTVEVKRSVRSARLAGFYERMERGLGQFITREDIEYTDLVGSFRRLLGVTVRPCRLTGGLASVSCYTLDFGRSRGIGSTCEPIIYLNGHPLAGGEGNQNAFTMLRSLERVIEAVEVYRNPAYAPGPYQILGDACGLVLAWTRRR